MSNQINITFGNETVGVVRFIQPDAQLGAVRTASGVRVHIPALMTFPAPSGSGSPLTLEHLRLTILGDASGKQIELGIASCDSIHTTAMQDALITFSWDWTLSAFAFYERIRAGREPKFRLQLCGDIRYILVGRDGGRNGKEPVSVATKFYEWGEVGYSRQIWTKMMRDVGVQDSILVEIPFPSDPPTGWEPIWTALRDARDSFDSGGSTGWKNAVTSVRLALEEWRKLEKEDPGPGWQAPKSTDLQSRTKSQRIETFAGT